MRSGGSTHLLSCPGPVTTPPEPSVNSLMSGVFFKSVSIYEWSPADEDTPTAPVGSAPRDVRSEVKTCGWGGFLRTIVMSGRDHQAVLDLTPPPPKKKQQPQNDCKESLSLIWTFCTFEGGRICRCAWKMITRVCVHVGACLCVSAQKLNRSWTRTPSFNALAPPPG